MPLMPLMPQFTIVSVAGLILTLIVWFFKWRMDDSAQKKKTIDDKDKEIDAARNADDIIRVSGG